MARSYRVASWPEEQKNRRAALWMEVLQLSRSSRISRTDMVLASSVVGPFKWRQPEPEVILLVAGYEA